MAGGTSSGNASNQLFGPGDVYADDQDNVYVLDGYNNRVQNGKPALLRALQLPAGMALEVHPASFTYPGVLC